MHSDLQDRPLTIAPGVLSSASLVLLPCWVGRRKILPWTGRRVKPAKDCRETLKSLAELTRMAARLRACETRLYESGSMAFTYNAGSTKSLSDQVGPFVAGTSLRIL